MSWQYKICEELGGTLAVKKMEQAMMNVIGEMLDAGCDLNKERWDDTPIWTLLLEDSEVPASVIRFILDQGGRLQEKVKNPSTSLFTAMENRMDHEVIKVLLKYGADASFVNEAGVTLLEVACNNDYGRNTFQLLIDKGAVMPSEEKEKALLLFFALENLSSHDVISFLIEQGADPSYIGDDNETSLQIACKSAFYDLETIQLLVEHGAPINEKKESCGNSPLGNATLFDLSDEVVEYLVEQGADIQAEDIEGNTPLLRLCYKADARSSTIEYLIGKGADLNHKNHEGLSAIGILCKGNGDPNMLETLIKYGLDVDSVEAGHTLPMIAAQNENWQAVKVLLSSGFSEWEVNDPDTQKTLRDYIEEGIATYWDDELILQIMNLVSDHS